MNQRQRTQELPEDLYERKGLVTGKGLPLFLIIQHAAAAQIDIHGLADRDDRFSRSIMLMKGEKVQAALPGRVRRWTSYGCALAQRASQVHLRA